MDKKTSEMLTILQEECAEVIQVVSKIYRFGLNDAHPETGVTNKERLEQEVGDLIAMVDLLLTKDIIDEENAKNAAEAKVQKLRKWSSIFEDD